MILLNCVDVFEPKIYALIVQGDVIHRLHQLLLVQLSKFGTD